MVSGANVGGSVSGGTDPASAPRIRAGCWPTGGFRVMERRVRQHPAPCRPHVRRFGLRDDGRRSDATGCRPTRASGTFGSESCRAAPCRRLIRRPWCACERASVTPRASGGDDWARHGRPPPAPIVEPGSSSRRHLGADARLSTNAADVAGVPTTVGAMASNAARTRPCSGRIVGALREALR